MRLEGKTALVTGGASGFGAEIARRFAAEGARVTILDIDEAGARHVAAQSNGAITAVKGDVTHQADVEHAVAQAAAGGRLDIVVNNAGWTHRNKPMMEVSEAEFDKVYAINVKSIFHMMRAVTPLMRAQGGGGSIINIGSTAGISPRPGLSWYNSTKGAVNLVSRSLAAELAPDHIRVNCVAPVIGESALLESFMGLPDTPENRAKFIATIPLRRMSRPADIANACVYLAEDASAFVTGVVLPIDGGRTI